MATVISGVLKHPVLLAVAPFAFALCTTSALAGTGQPAAKREVQLAREYVLAACIINRYPGTALAKEAEIWAEGIIEKGTVPAEIYATLAAIARTDAPQPFQSRNGTLMLMESCTKLYNSSSLTTKIVKILHPKTKKR